MASVTISFSGTRPPTVSVSRPAPFSFWIKKIAVSITSFQPGKKWFALTSLARSASTSRHLYRLSRSTHAGPPLEENVDRDISGFSSYPRKQSSGIFFVCDFLYVQVPVGVVLLYIHQVSAHITLTHCTTAARLQIKRSEELASFASRWGHWWGLPSFCSKDKCIAVLLTAPVVVKRLAGCMQMSFATCGQFPSRNPTHCLVCKQ